MSARNRIDVEVIDVGGSFRRFIDHAPKEYRRLISGEVKTTAFALQQRMKAKAPVGPDAPHIRDFVTHDVRGLTARVGFIDATDAAAPSSDASIGDVAAYNEWNPNKQPFIKVSAEAEAPDFVRRVTSAIGQAERILSGGGGLL